VIDLRRALALKGATARAQGYLLALGNGALALHCDAAQDIRTLRPAYFNWAQHRAPAW